MRYVKLVAVVVLMFVMGYLEAKEYDLSNYGVRAWSFENASPAIVKVIAEAKFDNNIILKFPGGRIDLWPEGAVKKELYISNCTENNTFYRTGMHAILIANDCNNWYESGTVTDVTIRGNRFIQCGYNQNKKGYVICIKPEIPHLEKNRYVHSNIRIIGNEFQCASPAVIYARSVDGLLFQNNAISFVPLEDDVSSPTPELKIEHCNSVDTTGNKYLGFAE